MRERDPGLVLRARSAFDHNVNRRKSAQNFAAFLHVGSGKQRLPVVPGWIPSGKNVEHAARRTGCEACRMVTASDGFADPFDTASQNDQRLEGGQRFAQ